MKEQETKKVLKLNDIDRHVLLTYSNMLMETQTKAVTEAADTKLIHKNMMLKI
jgi:hypothetical protein